MAHQCRPRRNWKSGRFTTLVIGCMALLALVMLAGCRSAPPPPSASGGVYTSSEYHFRVTYPNGWQVSTPAGTTPTPSTTIPLEIVITRIDAQSAGGAQVSSFTVVVYNAKDKYADLQIKQLLEEAHEPNSPPHITPFTIAGKAGYQDAPVQGTIPGSQITDTHTDYYLITPDYEYQISTDAVSGDNAASALQAMLKSFTVLS
ncbi:MAG: hypothetical protein ACLQUY_19465 [Ktedonobacterales bacterium]